MLTQREIAEAFSNGQFDKVYSCFSDDIEWNVIGEKQFNGKEAVIRNCEQTAAYFATVTTRFRTINVITGHNRVAINGTAEFIREGKTVARVSACDVYEFDDGNKLTRILSYCIPEK